MVAADGGPDPATLTIIEPGTRGTRHAQERSGPAIASLVAFPTLLLAFVTALLLALLWFLRGALTLRSLVLALCLWRLLLMLGHRLRGWLRLTLGLRFRRGALALLRSLVLVLHPCCPLLMLYRRLLWLFLRLDLRAALLGGNSGRGGLLSAHSSGFRMLSAWGRCSALLG
jgi:hypothetical protein